MDLASYYVHIYAILAVGDTSRSQKDVDVSEKMLWVVKFY